MASHGMAEAAVGLSALASRPHLETVLTVRERRGMLFQGVFFYIQTIQRPGLVGHQTPIHGNQSPAQQRVAVHVPHWLDDWGGSRWLPRGIHRSTEHPHEAYGRVEHAHHRNCIIHPSTTTSTGDHFRLLRHVAVMFQIF